jgi:hypothetical protein
VRICHLDQAVLGSPRPRVRFVFRCGSSAGSPCLGNQLLVVGPVHIAKPAVVDYVSSSGLTRPHNPPQLLFVSEQTQGRDPYCSSFRLPLASAEIRERDRRPSRCICSSAYRPDADRSRWFFHILCSGESPRFLR